jgi:hypothetical protein
MQGGTNIEENESHKGEIAEGFYIYSNPITIMAI